LEWQNRSLRDNRFAIEQPKTNDFPDRGSLSNPQTRGDDGAGHPDLDAHQFRFEVNVIPPGRKSVKKVARSSRIANDSLSGNKRSDTLLPFHSTRAFEFIQRPSYRNKTEPREFDQLNRSWKPAARLEILVLDHFEDHLFDDLVPQFTLWCGLGHRTQLTGRLRSSRD
jgi:hypothetical protein